MIFQKLEKEYCIKDIKNMILILKTTINLRLSTIEYSNMVHKTIKMSEIDITSKNQTNLFLNFHKINLRNKNRVLHRQINFKHHKDLTYNNSLTRSLQISILKEEQQVRWTIWATKTRIYLDRKKLTMIRLIYLIREWSQGIIWRTCLRGRRKKALVILTIKNIAHNIQSKTYKEIK